MAENRCVCCGDIIPEGRQVCPICVLKEQRRDAARRYRENHRDEYRKYQNDYYHKNTEHLLLLQKKSRMGRTNKEKK